MLSSPGKHRPRKICIYCDERPATTGKGDHVIPRQLFPEPRPNNLITVPCCEVCNSGFQHDEEHFTTLFVAHAAALGVSTQATEIGNKRMVEWLTHRPKLREYIREYIVPLADRKNIPPYIEYGIEVSTTSVKRVLSKMTKGLFYHHTGLVLAKGYRVWSRFDLDDEQVERYVKPFAERGQRPEILGNGVFSYLRAQVEGDPKWTIWMFVIYDCVFAVSTTAPSWSLSIVERRTRVKRKRSQRRALPIPARHPAKR